MEVFEAFEREEFKLLLLLLLLLLLFPFTTVGNSSIEEKDSIEVERNKESVEVYLKKGK